jgi:SAM-dependent methyltransferase
VIHHSPDTPRAVDEIYRVLKPGGSARIMIYHKYSLVGFMLWLRYALLAGRPFTSLRSIYARWLESPRTKAYSRREARDLFGKFTNVSIDIHLGHADLLSSRAGQRHEGALLAVARRIWPRWFFRRFCRGNGLTMMIRATKVA